MVAMKVVVLALLVACAGAARVNLRAWAKELASLTADRMPCPTAFVERGDEDTDLAPKKKDPADEPTPGLPKLDPCGVPSAADIDAAADGPAAANATINVTAADHKAAAYTGMPEPSDGTGSTGSTGATGAGAAAVEHEEKLEAMKTAQGKIAAAKAAREKAAKPAEAPVVHKRFKEPGCEKIRKTAQGAYMIAPKADKSEWTTKELMKAICGAYTTIEIGEDAQGDGEWKSDCANSVTFNAMARGWKNTDKRLLDSDNYKGCAPPREKELLECAIAFGIEQDNNFLGKMCRKD